MWSRGFGKEAMWLLWRGGKRIVMVGNGLLLFGVVVERGYLLWSCG